MNGIFAMPILFLGLVAFVAIFILALVAAISWVNAGTVATLFRSRGRGVQDLPDENGELHKGREPSGLLHACGVNVMGVDVVEVEGLKFVKPNAVSFVSRVNPDVLLLR
ncbi:MAG: hypothetical protein ABL985_17085 [Casimicrobium sp.]